MGDSHFDKLLKRALDLDPGDRCYTTHSNGVVINKGIFTGATKVTVLVEVELPNGESVWHVPELVVERKPGEDRKWISNT